MARRININAGLKTDNTVLVSDSGMFNGCSGYYYLVGMDQRPQLSYSSPFHKQPAGGNKNFWDLLQEGSPYGGENKGKDTRIRVLFVNRNLTLPSPRNWFKHPDDYTAFYLKAGDDILAVMGAAKVEMMNDPATPPAEFISEPEKHVSLAHLEASGLFNADRMLEKEQKYFNQNYGYGANKNRPKFGEPHVSKPRLYMHGGGQYGVTDSADYGLRPYVGNFEGLAHEWSREFDWLDDLPWWERYRLSKIQYASAADLVQIIVDSFAESKPTPYNGLGWVAGNACMVSPYDSFRVVFAFHSLNPAATLDYEATPSVLPSKGGDPIYYKIIPFYFHSPQHGGHRVAGMFLSREPIHMEQIA